LIETYDNDSIVGGEHYLIIRQDDDLKAMANGDKVIVRGEEVELEALNQETDASYKWYNNEQEIDSLQITTATPPINTTYILEVIRDENGNKDYDTVNVVVKNGRINTISPNPANDIITVNYTLSNTITSAYIRVKNTNGLVQLTVPVDMTTNVKQVYLGSLASGNYLVELVSTTEVLDGKTVIKL
jgi:hypothetical protein